jgi:hypothetical protein
MKGTCRPDGTFRGEGMAEDLLSLQHVAASIARMKVEAMGR